MYTLIDTVTLDRRHPASPRRLTDSPVAVSTGRPLAGVGIMTSFLWRCLRTVCMVGACWFLWGGADHAAAADTTRLWQEETQALSTEIQRGLDIFASLAEKLSPAVVNISTVQKSTRRGERPFRGFRSPFREREPFGTDPFREFFERFFGDLPPRVARALALALLSTRTGSSSPIIMS